MTVEILADGKHWDEFVDKSRYGMLFHKWDFLKIAEKHTGYTFYPYGIYKGEELIALFPVFIKKYLGMGMAYSPPPRSGIPYLSLVPGPQFDNVRQAKKEAQMKLVVEDLEAELTRLSVKHTYFSFAPGVTDIRQFMWNGFEQNAKFTYHIDLKRPVEELWKALNTRTRLYISKESLTVERVEDVSIFFRVMNDRYSQQKISFPIVSEQYVSDLLKAYPDNLKMYLFRRNDEIANVQISCMYKDIFFEWMGGVNVQKDYRANEFMRWHFIKEAKELGYGTYEMYGADVMQLCQNKNKFNPSLSCTFTLEKKTFTGMLAESAYQAGSRLKNIMRPFQAPPCIEKA